TIYATYVSAFRDVRPYERAFFYYVYRADAATVKDRIPINISPRCRKGYICSFNEFNKYISNPNNEDLKMDLPNPNIIVRTITNEIRGEALSSTKLDSLNEGPIKDFLKLNAYATITSVARIRKERII
ncbi:hypothetical protein D6C78_11077, partial [Aureobasidium pullulans]